MQELLSKGFTINAITIDGKKGLNKVFKDYPIQMCQFHQKMIVKRYITRHTTNSIDGVFSHFKKLAKVHSGILENMKIKVIDEFFYNYNNKL